MVGYFFRAILCAMRELERIVYFDMDGVMYDFDAAAGAGIPQHARRPRTTFYINDDYPEYRQLIEDTYNHPDFFYNLELVSGIRETWEALYQSGRQPQILSSPLSSNPASIEGKRASLERDFVPYFGKRVLEEALFDKHKWKYSGIALLDDRPDMPRGPEGLDLNPWAHVFVEWKYERLAAPMTTAAYRLIDFSNPAHIVDMIDRIEHAGVS